MEYIDNRLAVTAEETMMPFEALNKMVVRGKVEKARRGCRGQKAMYYVDSLPKKVQAIVLRDMPATALQKACNSFADSVAVDWRAMQYYANYTTADGKHLLYDKQVELANNARLLNTLIARREECSTKIGSNKRFWALAVEEISKLGIEIPNSLPRNARRLQEKAREYAREGYGVLVSEKFGNTNAKVVDELIMQTLLSHHNNLDCETVATLYNKIMALGKGNKPISASTVAVYLRKHHVLTLAGRHGERVYRSERSMIVKRTAPKYPCVMWSTDGWDVELLYQEGGKYYNRLTVVVVLDTCCNYPMGYAIGEQESASLIREAVKNAINHSKQLFGNRYKVDEWQSDHYAQSALARTYATVANHVILPRVGNAKAKPVERYFGTLNNKYCKLMNNWSGYGVTSRKELQPNVDMQKLSKDCFPDKDGCRAQIIEIMEAERKSKREQILAMWAECPVERKYELSDKEYLREFGETTGFLNAQNREGLTPTLLGTRRVYDCFSRDWRKYDYVKWQVRYDADDFSKVLAVSEDGTLEYMLDEKYVQPMAIADRTEEDCRQLARVRDYNKQQDVAIADQLALATEHTKKVLATASAEAIDGVERKNLDILSKYLITDRNGQHKDHKSAARRGVKYTEYEEVENAAAMCVQKDCNSFAEEENTRNLW